MGGGESCHICHFLVARGGMKKGGKSGQLATFAIFLPVGDLEKSGKCGQLATFFCPSEILKKVARFPPPHQIPRLP